MQAIRINAFSAAMDNTVVEDVPTPSHKSGEVLVRMLYAPIHPADFNFIRGDYHSALSRAIWNYGSGPVTFGPGDSSIHPEPPYTLGVEGVGVVESSGGGLLANRLKGKRVSISAGPPQGSWQQYTVVDAKKAIPVPDAMESTEAAFFLANPLSCYAMVADILRVKPDSWLLQSGAASALGQMVIRLGQHMGYKTINLVRSSANVDKLRALGADVVVNSSEQDLQKEVHVATGGQGVAYAMDCIGGDLLTGMMQCLSVAGHMVVYGTLSGLSNTFYSRDLMMPCARVSGYYGPNWLAQKSLLQKLSIIRAVKKLHLAGVFDTEIGEVLPMEDVKKGIELASTQGHVGKVLLKLND